MIRERDVPLGGWSPVKFWRRRPETALAIAVGTMAVAGLVLRLVELAERPLHHDESIDAWYSWQFLEGTFEGYDPVYHGPLRFYLTAAFFWVFGESHTTARMVAVLAGVGLIVLPWFLRRSLGPVVTLTAAAVLAFSPIALYMTRLGREDSLTAFITLAMMVVIVRFLDRPRLLLPALFGFLLAAGFAVKETTFIFVFIFGGFFLALLAEQATQHNSEGRTEKPLGRFAGWSWMLPAGLVPMGIAFGVSAYYDAEVFVTLGVYGVLMAMVILMRASPAQIWDLPVVRAARGVSGWGWVLAAAVFLFFFALWFTVFFTNSAGFVDGFTEGITYWRGEQDTNRGSEPWHYYLYTIGLYEYVVCILAVIGAIHVFRSPSFVGKLMLWTAVASWFSYSWASERFPWLALHILVPMGFLAGYGVQVLWQARRRVWMVPVWVVLAGLLATTLFVSWRVNYDNQRDPRELLTQVHTTDDYLDTVHRIEALNEYSKSIGEGPVTVAVDTAISVPNLWYFRDYEARTWTDSASAQHVSADFVLHLPESNILGVAAELADHQTTRLPLRDWWAPQFESYHDGWVSGWARWLVSREVWNEGTLGSTNFDLSVSPRALDLEARVAAG
ncbi:flippase activity-associated protein Agl23 [Candidatus Poriferisocius sp.]|uniref:flippase activity-associated protein Agl23 n=1 Tax=Candidatus Poriferisocius sp. TaxID=3101276 RepID=UPI003B01C773